MTSKSPTHSDKAAAADDSQPDDSGWEVPTSSTGEIDDAAATASAPDASPLTHGPAGDGPGAGGNQFWSEGKPLSGWTSNSRPVPPEQPDEEPPR